MFNKESYRLGSGKSAIRELFEYGLTLKEKGITVCDFSLGNPSVPTTQKVTDEIVRISSTDPLNAHSYTAWQGDKSVRKAVASNLSKKGKITYSEDDIIMTTGAAGSLSAVLHSVVENENDEIIVLKPYFIEYKVFVECAKGKLVEVDCKDGFKIDFDDLKSKITDRTKAVIINSPNNPTGQIYDENEIKTLADILSEKGRIYLISDEPYREIVFDGYKLPFIPDYYADTVICYSFSKTLSIPGERIGYVAISPKCFQNSEFRCAVIGAQRKLGYVCAPSLFQHVIKNCIDEITDFSVYEQNRDRLITELERIGFTCNRPKGAFYLMIKSPDGDGKRFSDVAKTLGLLIVPGEPFGAKGYVRIATCVSKETVANSIPKFEKLKEIY